MIALLVLIGLIALIARSSRAARSEYIVKVPSRQPGETWIFNVRDMVAELVRTRGERRLAYYELRRLERGAWEMRLDDRPPLRTRGGIFFPMGVLGSEEEPPAASGARTWTRCEEPEESTIERAYRRYNGDSSDNGDTD